VGTYHKVASCMALVWACTLVVLACTLVALACTLVAYTQGACREVTYRGVCRSQSQIQQALQG